MRPTFGRAPMSARACAARPDAEPQRRRLAAVEIKVIEVRRELRVDLAQPLQRTLRAPAERAGAA
jgi:hypothetical protein